MSESPTQTEKQTEKASAKQATPDGAVRFTKDGAADRFAYTPGDVVAAEWDGYAASDPKAVEALQAKALKDAGVDGKGVVEDTRP